jgi:hypothetical protein
MRNLTAGSGLVAAVILAGCAASPNRVPSSSSELASSRSTSAASAVASPAASPTVGASPTVAASPVPDLVGEWRGSHDCEVIRKILIDHGYADFVNETVVGEEMIPGVSDPNDLRDPKRPCLDARSVPHWHFFRADGMFGSLDENREQVDDNSYLVISAHRFQIGDVPFDYTVDGDSLTMNPAALEKNCVHGQWCQNIWMLMVSLPGTTWKRSG